MSRPCDQGMYLAVWSSDEGLSLKTSTDWVEAFDYWFENFMPSMYEPKEWTRYKDNIQLFGPNQFSGVLKLEPGAYFDYDSYVAHQAYDNCQLLIERSDVIVKGIIRRGKTAPAWSTISHRRIK